MHTRLTREVPGMLDMIGVYQVIVLAALCRSPTSKLFTSESWNQMTGHKHEGLKVQTFLRGRLRCRF